MAKRCVMNKGHWEFIENFRPSEFRCPCGCCETPTDMDFRLIYILQAIRNEWCKPVNISKGGGVRCKAYNESLSNSVKNSDHLISVKKAADFSIPGVTETYEGRLEVIKFVKSMPGFKYAYCDGIVVYADGKSKAYKAPLMGKCVHISVD